MSNPCSSPSCLNGNCIGCKNGIVDCQDPRCFPLCQNCNTTTSTNSNWIIITIILILLGVLLIMFFIVGYDWFFARKKAAEPKNLVVNKHIRSVNPPPIVINSPMTSVPVPVSVPIMQESIIQETIIPEPMISQTEYDNPIIIQSSMREVVPKENCISKPFVSSFSENSIKRTCNTPMTIQGFE